MTQDQIILLADASGISLYGMGKDRDKFIQYLQAFAKLVAAKEREACAKVVEEPWQGHPKEIAKAIRARGEA